MNTQERHEMEVVVLKQAVIPEWISYPEAERYSGLSHTTLWRYVGSGELRAAKVGRSVRIHFPALRTFMNEKAKREFEHVSRTHLTEYPQEQNSADAVRR